MLNSYVKKGAPAVAIALALALGLQTAGTAAAGGPKVNPQPTSKLVQNGTMTWPINSMPPNFNTSHVDGNEAGISNIMDSTLPSFFTVDAGGNLVVDKNYAVSVTLTKKSPQVVTYVINPKAVWSDGKKISYKDFEGHWKASNGSNKDFETVSTTGYEDIASVKRGKNDQEVVVTFKKAYADWQGLFGGLLPTSVTATPAAFNTSWKDKPLLTAGPFQYQSKDDTAKSVTVVRNPKWWGPKPVLGKIVFRAIVPGAQMDAFANGEIDFVDIANDVDKFKRAKTLKNTRIDVSQAPNYRHFTFGSKGVMADKRVRQAIFMAIDRNTITKAMIGTIDPTATPLDNHIFMKNLGAYKANAGIYGKYDLQRADALLDSAGWTGNPRKKDGQELKVRMVIPAGVPTSARESQLAKAMLDPLGVVVDIVTVPSADFFSKYITPGDFDMTVFTWIGTIFPISSSKSIYSLPVAGSDAGQNYGGVGSAKIDSLFDQATKELDPKKANALANQIDALIWAEGHSMTIYQRPNVVASKSKLANFGAFGFSSVDYTKIGFTK